MKKPIRLGDTFEIRLDRGRPCSWGDVIVSVRVAEVRYRGFESLMVVETADGRRFTFNTNNLTKFTEPTA